MVEDLSSVFQKKFVEPPTVAPVHTLAQSAVVRVARETGAAGVDGDFLFDVSHCAPSLVHSDYSI